MIGNVYRMAEAPGAASVDLSAPELPPPGGGPDFWSMLLVALSSKSAEEAEGATLEGQDLGASAMLESKPARPLEALLRSLVEWQADRITSEGGAQSSEPGDHGSDGLERVGEALVIETRPSSGEQGGDETSSTDSARPVAVEGGVTLRDVALSDVQPTTASPDPSAPASPATDLDLLVSAVAPDLSIAEVGLDPLVSEVDASGTEAPSQPIDGTRHAPTDGLAGRAADVADTDLRVVDLDAPQPGAPNLRVEPAIESTRRLDIPGVDVPDPAMAHLLPELRDKLERVIDRMRDEYGHDVELAEGYRSKERQAHLYEQGRTRPGPIVTWTRSSLHSEGRAADIVIDGGYENKQAYARLQHVAGEEGLRNIGARDSGHLELAPERDPRASPGRLPTALQGRSVANSVGVMRIAAVARVASVARVARPGDYVVRSEAAELGIIDAPASGADDGLSSRLQGRADGANARIASLLPDKGTAVPTSSLDEPEGAIVRELETGGSRRSARGKGLAVTSTESSQIPHLASAPTQSTHLDAPKAVSASSGGVSTAEVNAALERVEEILATRDLFRSTQPARISLNLGTGGPVSRLRVGLLGRTIDADLDLADGVSKRLIGSRVSELHRALFDRGLQLGTLGLNGRSQLSGPPTEAWLPGGAESAMDVMRSLLAGGSDPDREGSARGRNPAEHQMKQNGAGSDRPGRERKKENDS